MARNIKASSEEKGFLIRESLESYAALPIGKALNLLITSDEKSFTEALFATASTSPTAHAFRSLDHHLHVDPKDTLNTLVNPLLEKLLQSPEPQKSKITRLFTYVSQQKNVQVFLFNKLNEVFSTSNNKWKLGSVIIIKSFIDSYISTSSSLQETKVEENAKIIEIDNSPKIRENKQSLEFSVFVSSLLKCVKEESIKEGLGVSPTRLTVAAADAFLAVTYAIALDCPSTDHAEFSSDKHVKMLGNSVESMRELIQNLIKWYEEHRPLLVVALKQIAGNLDSIVNYLKADPENHWELGTKILIGNWTLYAPYLMEVNVAVSKNMYKELLYLLSLMPDPMGSNTEEELTKEQEEQMSLNSLICVCLILGKLKSTAFNQVVNQIREHLQPQVLKQLYVKDENAQGLAVQLLQRVMFIDSSEEAMSSLVQPMMALLESRDATSKAVVGFVAQFAASYPSKILDQIFQYLDSSDKLKRRNALDILTEVFTINRNATNEQSKDLGQRLAESLLMRLHDEELTLRSQSASLFANLEPTFIVPKLAKLTTDRDARVRSAADSALLAVLSGHKDVTSTIEVLLDCLRQEIATPGPAKASLSPADLYNNKATPQTPADLFKSNNNNNKSDLSDRVLRKIPDWASLLPNSVWPLIIKSIVTKLFATPQDEVGVKFISKIGGQMSDYPLILLPMVLERMKTQAKLTEELVTSQSEESVSVVQSLIFERIRPLLILKVLSLPLFQADENSEEPDIVTKRNLLKELSELLLTSLCSQTVLYERFIEPYGISDLIPVLFDVLQLKCPPPTQTGPSEVQKAQHGSIDLLGLLIKASYVKSDTMDSLSSLLSLILQQIKETDLFSFVICLFNVLISATKTIPIANLKIFAKDIIYPMTSFYSDKKRDAVHRSASIQVLFTLMFHLKADSAPYARDLLDLSISTTSDSDPQIRLNGLKLLGAILSHAEEDLFENNTNVIWDLQKSLHAIANMDSSTEARQLAEKFLDLLERSNKEQ